MSGEFGFYNYVPDTNIWTDEFGLAYDKHKKNGQFAKKPGRKSKKQRKNRKNQYPSGYRAGIVDSVVKKNTINGVIYDKFGNPIARKDVTIEHNKPVVQHWNEGGNNMSRAERADFYNDTSNMSILTKADNSSGGGLMNDVYTQTTGPNYSN